MPLITNDWLDVISSEFKKPYYIKLYKTLVYEYDHYTIYPPKDDLLNAFHATPYSKVKVVILGQDPYYNPGQAHGMCFSVRPGVKIPPSLQNIFKEIHDELGTRIPNNGFLMEWAEQGVFLLNTVLTVRAGKPESHKGIGWETFTDACIKALDEADRPMVFMLWGRHARDKKALLKNPRHLVLEAAHPSPLSAYNGFFGCGHFRSCNEFLEKNGLEPIDWQISDR